MVLVAIIIGVLSAITQYLKYKNTAASFWIKKIALQPSQHWWWFFY
jgi:hypothetical protein